MAKSRVLVVGICAATLVGATVSHSVLARTRSAAQIEYLRLSAQTVRIPVAANSIEERVGYRACAAGVSEWTCREFQPNESRTSALRSALSTLGTEGWDLVSVVNEEPELQSGRGVTYLFKRQIPQ